MKHSVEVLRDLLAGAEYKARYHRNMETDFHTPPAKRGKVLREISAMHRRDAEKAEARAADYRAALEVLLAAEGQG